MASTSRSPQKFQCIYCPLMLRDDVEIRMSAYHLRLHMAAYHVDKKRFAGDQIVEYSCNGNGKSSIPFCAPGKPHKTLAVNNYVAHLKSSHPDEAIPFSVLHKAALSNFKAELSMSVSTENMPPDERKRLVNPLLQFP